MLTETLPEKKSEYIPTLDGWRAIAITMVLISHGFWSHSTAFGYDSGWKRALHAIISHAGPAGVLLFFSISGFLICSRLLNDGSLKRFYIRRLFRIVPPALAYLLVVATLVLFGLVSTISDSAFYWSDWFSALGFVLNYKFSQGTYLVVHFWSLAVEEQFYLLWPGLLLLLKKERAAKFAFILAFGSIIWRAYSIHVATTPLQYAKYLGHTDLRLDSFMFPCAIAIAFSYERYRNMIRHLGDLRVQLMVIFAILAVSWGSELSRIASVAEKSIIPALFTMLVIGTVMNPKAWLGRLLEFSAIRWVGRLSYSLYLWQQIAIFRANPSNPAYSGLISSFLLRLPIVFALALASYYWIEVPFIRIGRKLADRSPIYH